MVQINFAKREINCKIVYYGPGLSGKTTNLEKVHEIAPSDIKGNLTSIATEGDRTLFFDFMPLDLGEVAGMRTKLQLYTVPGQVYYNSTRKLVLQGVDGVVFVADSAEDRLEANLESYNNLKENLKEYGLGLKNLPFVLQYNKRDLSNILPVSILQEKLNEYDVPYFEAIAIKGDGVMSTLKTISKLVLDKLNKEYGTKKRAAIPSVKPVAVTPSSTPSSSTKPTPESTIESSTSSASASSSPQPVKTLSQKSKTLQSLPPKSKTKPQLTKKVSQFPQPKVVKTLASTHAFNQTKSSLFVPILIIVGIIIVFIAILLGLKII